MSEFPHTMRSCAGYWYILPTQTLELDVIGDRLIGSDMEGGLSLEQRKRTTLGVELAANPSLIFLDEPTSGLDARSAQVIHGFGRTR